MAKCQRRVTQKYYSRVLLAQCNAHNMRPKLYVDNFPRTSVARIHRRNDHLPPKVERGSFELFFRGMKATCNRKNRDTDEDRHRTRSIVVQPPVLINPCLHPPVPRDAALSLNSSQAQTPFRALRIDRLQVQCGSRNRRRCYQGKCPPFIDS